MKLQEASIRELKRISVGTLACDGLMVAGLFLLSQFGIGTFDLGKILLSALCGSVVAICNFAILCLTIQSCVEIQDQKQMQARFQLSYNLRMVLQAGWAVLAFLLPPFHFIAGALPVLFPKITLLYLQFKGKLVLQDPQSSGDNNKEM